MANLTVEQRRKIMQSIKSKNTLPEKILMKALREKGIYFTKHRKDVYGTPDIVFKRKKIAVFIDSEFWHGRAHIPKQNTDYWLPKLQKNKQRDELVNTELKNTGWRVLRFTDTEVKKETVKCIQSIIDIL